MRQKFSTNVSFSTLQYKTIKSKTHSFIFRYTRDIENSRLCNGSYGKSAPCFSACSFCQLVCKFQGQWQVNVLSLLCYVLIRDIIALCCKNTFPDSLYEALAITETELIKIYNCRKFQEYQERSLMIPIWHFYLLQCERKASWTQSRYDNEQFKSTIQNIDYGKSSLLFNTCCMNTQEMAEVILKVSSILLFMLHSGQRRNTGEEKRWDKKMLLIFLNSFSPWN